MPPRGRTEPIDLTRRVSQGHAERATPGASVRDSGGMSATIPVTPGEATRSPRAFTLPDRTERDEKPSVETTDTVDTEGPTAVHWGCPACGAKYSAELEMCPIDGEPLRSLSWIFSEPDVLVGCLVATRYEVERVLGRGGMGTVYQVRHTKLGKRFALKVLRREVASDSDSVKRFIQEAQIAAAVKHENLADVTDCGEITRADLASLGEERLPFFVMEMLQGESLGERIRERGAIDAKTAAEVLRQCALGLAAAHAEGVIHRDLKPDNIFLTENEGKLVCKLLDFGVAKILRKRKLTQAGTVFGTPYYMSPEQASGADIDGRADIYALGVVLYEALTGEVPFSAETHMGVLTKHVFEVPRPIETVVDDPQRLGTLGPIVMRCLEKDRAHRFADALELARAVEAAGALGASLPVERPDKGFRLRDPTPALPPRRALEKKSGPRWGVWAVIGALACASIVLGVVHFRSQAQASSVSTGLPGERATAQGERRETPMTAPPAVHPEPLAPTAAASQSEAYVPPAASASAASKGHEAGPVGHPPAPASSSTAAPRRNIEIVDPW